jgi:hypothetical protein
MKEIHPHEFWQWAHSNFLSNAERGRLAEFIVAKALGSLSAQREEWDAWDVTSKDGIKVEVKASGYIQSWHQTKPSTLRFDIKKPLSWHVKTNIIDGVASRSADVYVFCVHKEKNTETANPLILN